MATFVLIPGAGGAGWYWHRVQEQLGARGHEAIAVDLPADDVAAGLAAYASIVTEAAVGRGEVVLVAQSMGGFTVPLVWSALPTAAVVFVNAMIPQPGERAGEWWENVGQPEARVAAALAGGYSVEFDLDTYFLHDVPPAVAADGERHQRDESEAAFAEVCDFSWPEVPVHAVAGRDDRFFPLALQQRVARDRLGIDIDVLPGGHLMALSQPTALTDYLLAAVDR
ncbi:alpha/beta hydrolase [Jatrophihabitans sp.]|uniref:alpha/beta fold hydrolase n=1 Tax=Jatrophihabitans sp. TaxID=1932789 RepID=UPI0030C76B37|nr:hypothetical protein [Jatrophihabitans sp.]